MKYVGVKTTGELRLRETDEVQTDKLYMAVEDTKVGASPIKPYQFVKWDSTKWVKVDNVELATTLDTKNIEDALAAAVDDLQDKIDEVTLDPSAVALGNVHLLDEVTEFPADGCILIDSETNGPGDMSKDTLLELTAQNALEVLQPRFYVSDSGYIYIEESRLTNGKIWFKAVGGQFSIRFSSIKFTETTAQFAVRLGLSLEQSSSGQYSCIPLESGKCIVISDDSVLVKDRSDVVSTDIVLISNLNGSIDSVNTIVFGAVIAAVTRRVDEDFSTSKNLLNTAMAKGFFSLDGNNSRTDSIEFPLVKDSIYKIIPANTTWNVSSIGSDSTNKFVLSGTRENGSSVTLASYTKLQTLPASFTVSIPSDVVSAHISYRADTGSNNTFTLVYEGSASVKDVKCRGQLYSTDMYVEQTNISGGSIYISTLGGSWYLREAPTSFSYTQGEFASAVGKTLVTSPKGVKNCIEIESTNALVFKRDGSVAIVNRSLVSVFDKVLAACVDGRLVAYSQDMFGELLNGQIPLDRYYPKAYESLQTKLCGLQTGKCDSSIFITDIHIPQTAGQWLAAIVNIFDGVRRVFESFSINSVISGGDWITGGMTQENTLRELTAITGMFNKLQKFVPMLGNHDTNYQGSISSDNPANGRLDQKILNSVMFGHVGGRAYYEYDSCYTHYFIFDTGVDNDATVNSYRQEQVLWFGERLTTLTKEKIALGLHIVTTQTISTGEDFTPTLFATDLLDVATAFNARTSVTKYGETFDFSSVVAGHIEFVLGGHVHVDSSKVVSGIPIVLTKNYASGDYDIVVANYTTNKLNFVRIGSGNDREFDLFSSSL